MSMGISCVWKVRQSIHFSYCVVQGSFFNSFHTFIFPSSLPSILNWFRIEPYVGMIHLQAGILNKQPLDLDWIELKGYFIKLNRMHFSWSLQYKLTNKLSQCQIILQNKAPKMMWGKICTALWLVSLWTWRKADLKDTKHHQYSECMQVWKTWGMSCYMVISFDQRAP